MTAEKIIADDADNLTNSLNSRPVNASLNDTADDSSIGRWGVFLRKY